MHGKFFEMYKNSPCFIILIIKHCLKKRKSRLSVGNTYNIYNIHNIRRTRYEGQKS